MDHQSFHDPLNILDGYEGHLHIDLGELRLPIGPKVFIPKAPDDLKITVKSGHHQNLFEELGRLGQRIKVTRIEPAGDQKIPGPFRRALGEHRGLDLQKSEPIKVISNLSRDAMAQDQISLK